MKMDIRQIFLGVRLLIRLCWPATVFIGLCTGILIAFGGFLQFLSNITRDGRFIGGSWLLLLIFYIIFGVALIRFNAHLIHRSFGSEELRIQRRMATLSGLPFYAVCLLFLSMNIYNFFDPNVGGPAAFFGVAGFFGFILISCSYFLLIRFFLGRLATIAHRKDREKL